VRSLIVFLTQVGIFGLLLVGILFASKLLGKYSFYFLLALTLIALFFAIYNTSNFGSRPFLYVILFGMVSIVSIIKLMIKKS
jgi:hypothetical protein